MHQATFELFRKLIQETGGIALGEDKQALLRSRIRGRLGALQLESPEQYWRFIGEDGSGQELTHLIDSIATNYTFFFREEAHFDVLKDHLRARLLAGQRKIRIWSAACSSGEEPYSIAMLVKSILADLSIIDADVKILATDISTKILRQAVTAEYRENQLNRVPPEFRSCFRPAGRGDSIHKVRDDVRALVTFRKFNLNAPTFPMKGPFDAIFCRNVMIYFDEPTRKVLVNKFARLLAEDALLFVGMTESVMGYCRELPYREPSVYYKSKAALSLSH